MEFIQHTGPDEVHAVSFVRVMAALTDLGINYRVDDDDEHELVAAWPGYLARINWDGPFDPVLRVTARLWADMSADAMADLQRWISERHLVALQPVVTYLPTDDGRLNIVLRGVLSLKGGLSDVQLRAHLDRLLRSITDAACAVALEFPELTHTEPGFLDSIGVPAFDLLLPVTIDRIAEVVTALDVEDLDTWGNTIEFQFDECGYVCTVDQDGSWLRVSSPMESAWGNDHFDLLVDLANELNNGAEQHMVLVKRVSKWYRLAVETNTPISGGMTTAQLGEALRDAVWGHRRLSEICRERLQAIVKSLTSD